ncbi:10900_t:CDS:2, partial [Gigaspora rosea]
MAYLQDITGTNGQSNLYKWTVKFKPYRVEPESNSSPKSFHFTNPKVQLVYGI